MDKNISIIGSGLIGQQWAMIFTAYRWNIFIYDISDDQIKSCLTEVQSNLQQFYDRNVTRSDEPVEKQLSRISVTTCYDDLPKTSKFVMECVSENIEIKQKVFQLIDSHFSDETIRMSSSSFLPISTFTENLKYKSNCIIAHPVCPPYFLRLVEIIPAPYTCEGTILKTKQLMEEIKQIPVIFKKEIRGFGLNRIQAAVYNSVFKLIKDDVINVDDVDKLLTEGLGPRWAFYGPITVAALNGPGIENYCNKYLSGLDMLNTEQNFPPQHDKSVIERIVNESNIGDLSSIYQERNFTVGSILKMKFNQKL